MPEPVIGVSARGEGDSPLMPDRSEDIRAAVSQELGWEPVRNVPPALAELVDTAEGAALESHRKRTLRALEVWCESWEKVLGHPVFRGAPLPFRQDALNRAGIAAMTRYERFRDPDDFGRTRARFQAALDLAPEGSPERSRYLHNLGILHAGRYRILGRAEDSKRALALLSGALEELSGEGRLRALYHRSLCRALGAHYDRTGDLSYLERAAHHAEEALEHVDATSHLRRMVCNDLGEIYRRRFIRTRSGPDIQRALALLEEALEGAPDASVPYYLTNLSSALLERFGHAGDEADLVGAVEVAERAVELTSEEDPSRVIRLNNLGNALSRLHVRTEDPGLLDRVVATYRETVALTREGDPWLPSRLYNLGLAFRTRLFLRRQPKDAEAAVDAFREACKTGFQYSLEWALSAAYRWGELAEAFDHWDDAAEAYDYGLDVLSRLYDTQALPETRATWLSEARDLTLRAAHVEARRGNAARAVEILEEGRARSLHESLALRDALTGSLDPDRRAALSAALERVWHLEGRVRAVREKGVGGFTQAAQELERGRAELAVLVEELRAERPRLAPESLGLEELETLLRELGTPLVYLVAVPEGGILSLVARTTDADTLEVDSIFLDGLTGTELAGILHGGDGKGGYLRGITLAHSDELAAALDKAWPVLRREVVAPLERRIREAGFDQAVLIPTGMLTLLPLAAMAEEVTFSFVPSARALWAVHHDEDHLHRPEAFLGVGDPASEREEPLGFARLEVETVAELFRDRGSTAAVLAAGEATRAAVVSCVAAGATYVHLACHGRFSVDRPMESPLALAGSDRLTLADFFSGNVDVAAVRLVVLSACQTGLIDFLNAPDEVVGFPAGLVQASVPGVISTLWPVADVSTAVLLARFYRNHLGEGMEPARALHEARLWLRDATAEELDLAGHYERYLALHPDDAEVRESLARVREDLSARPFRHPWFWGAFIFTGR